MRKGDTLVVEFSRSPINLAQIPEIAKVARSRGIDLTGAYAELSFDLGIELDKPLSIDNVRLVPVGNYVGTNLPPKWTPQPRKRRVG